MQHTLQAMRYMIILRVILPALFFAFSLTPDNGDLALAGGYLLLSAGVIYLFILGLKRAYLWAAILFALICAFDLFVAISGGISLANSFHLVDAVLSFVALCGLAQWFKQRSGKLLENN